MQSLPEATGSVAEAAVDCAALGSYLNRVDWTLAPLGTLTATRLIGGRSNLTYLVTDGVHDFVLRRPPLGTLPPHSYNIAREYRMMAALSRQGIPIPGLLHLCEDESIIGSAFLIMKRVHGRVLRDETDALGLTREHSALLCDELVDALVGLHAVDVASIDAGAQLRGADFVARQVARWTGQWHRWQTRESPVVEELAVRLAKAVPVAARTCVVHGDYRFDNVMFDDDLTGLLAIFDWELSAVGDPLTDLGLLLAYWWTDGSLADLLPHKRLTAGLGISAGTLVDRYATATGTSVDNLGFYVALGYFKWAVIREGVFRRQLDGAMPSEDSAAIRDSVEIIAECGLSLA